MARLTCAFSWINCWTIAALFNWANDIKKAPKIIVQHFCADNFDIIIYLGNQEVFKFGWLLSSNNVMFIIRTAESLYFSQR